LANLLSGLIQIFLFLGVWFFLMKRMAGQQPGFMTLGKYKAKIYMQEDIEIRFADVAGAGEGKIESALDPKLPNLKQDYFSKKSSMDSHFLKKVSVGCSVSCCKAAAPDFETPSFSEYRTNKFHCLRLIGMEGVCFIFKIAPLKLCPVRMR
jgi:hypothetical protein